MPRIIAAMLVVTTVSSGWAQQPTKAAPARSQARPSPTETDPDKYTTVFENARVRVFRYHDEPGAKTKMHHHEAFVLHALAPFKRRLTFPDGSVKERDFKTGDVIWMEAQDHVGENIGTTSTEVMIVELKGSGAPVQ